jgi:hypothetical protein
MSVNLAKTNLTNRDKFNIARRKLVIESLVIPKSIDQVAKDTGIPYHTMRRVVAELLELGTVKPTGQQLGSKILYIQSSKADTIPTIYNEHGDVHFSPLDYIKSMAEANFPVSQTEVAARSFLTTVIELFHLAAVAGKTGAVDLESLNTLHHNLLNNIALIRSTVLMLQQLAEHEIFWSEEGLKKIASNNTFDQNQIEEIYIQYLRSVNTEFTDPTTETGE